MGVPVLDKPSLPADDRVRLRAKLIMEEAFETIEAMFDVPPDKDHPFERARYQTSLVIDHVPVKVDMARFADGCADLDYVVEGARLEFGIDGKPIADVVHVANMKKVPGHTTRADGKKLKPKGWEPPDVGGALVRQGWDENICHCGDWGTWPDRSKDCAANCGKCGKYQPRPL